MLIPLWNCWYFFALYANAAGGDGLRPAQSTASTHVLDRYLLAKTRAVRRGRRRAQLDDYEVANACDTMRGFIDVLTNWYIRRSRERFWAADAGRGVRRRRATAAFDTLYTVLETVLPGGRAAAAADHRGGLARPDR